MTEADALAGLSDEHGRVAGVVARLAGPTGAMIDAMVERLSESSPKAEVRPDLGFGGEGDARLAFDLCVALAPHAGDPAVFAALADAAARFGDPWLHAAVLAGAGRGPLTAALWSAGCEDAELLRKAAAVAGRRGEVAATAGLAVGDALAAGRLSPRAAAVLRGLHETAAGALKAELAGLPEPDRATLAATFARFVEETDDPAGAAFLLAPLPGTAGDLLALAADHPDPAARAAGVRLLMTTDEPAAADLVAALPAETPAVREALLDLALSGPMRTAALLDLLDAGELAPGAVGVGRANRLREHHDPAVRGRAEALFAPAGDRAAVLADYRSCLDLPADVTRGRAVFERACATCHAVDGVGVAVGPDVSDTYDRTPESLLTDVLDPNRAVDGGGFAYAALTADGRVLSGVLTSETAGSVTLLAPGGKAATVPRAELLELRSEGVSLMPEGMEKQLPPRDMADLIAFLKGWRYEQ